MSTLWRVLCAILEAVAWGLALVAAVGGIGANGGRWVDKLDYLTHPVMAFLALGIAAFVLSWFALSIGRGWTIRVLALAGIAGACLVIAPDITRARSTTTAAAPNQIKLIEFNSEDEVTDPGVVARWVAAQDPDIVVIVEPTKVLEQKLREATGLQTKLFDGTIVASRHAQVGYHWSWDYHELPGHGGFLNMPALYGFDGKPFDVAGVHLSWPIPASKRRSEDMHYGLIFDTRDRSRAILAGDFNSSQFSFRQRDADTLLGLERRDVATPTWPARIPQLHGRKFPGPPFMPIDHVYAGSYWRTVRVERGPRLGSDHYPLLATLAWDGPTGGDPRLWPNAR